MVQKSLENSKKKNIFFEKNYIDSSKITYKGLGIIVVVNRCKLLSMYRVYVSLTFELHTLFIRLHIRFLNLMREILDEDRIKMIRTE